MAELIRVDNFTESHQFLGVSDGRKSYTMGLSILPIGASAMRRAGYLHPITSVPPIGDLWSVRPAVFFIRSLGHPSFGDVAACPNHCNARKTESLSP